MIQADLEPVPNQLRIDSKPPLSVAQERFCPNTCNVAQSHSPHKLRLPNPRPNHYAQFVSHPIFRRTSRCSRRRYRTVRSRQRRSLRSRSQERSSGIAKHAFILSLLQRLCQSRIQRKLQIPIHLQTAEYRIRLQRSPKSCRSSYCRIIPKHSKPASLFYQHCKPSSFACT